MTSRVMVTQTDILVIESHIEPPPPEQIDKEGKAILTNYVSLELIEEAKKQRGQYININLELNTK